MSELQSNVSLKEYCTYAIGGPAKELIVVTTQEELKKLFKKLHCLKKRYLILGKGSNCLFDDRGFNGLVIVNKIHGITWSKESVRVGSGYSFSLLGTQASRKGYAGLEFASGIPGSVGGAVYMNAGAGGSETKDVLEEVEFFHEEGHTTTYKRGELPFSYRVSPFQTMRGAVVAATFRLVQMSSAKETQEKLLAYRMKTQPYKEKSCGCLFRNPEGDSAGRLIELAGLKGLSQGGAKVSLQHANFVVNENQATAENILDLMKYIQVKVYHQFQILLEPEVRYIPYDAPTEV